MYEDEEESDIHWIIFSLIPNMISVITGVFLIIYLSLSIVDTTKIVKENNLILLELKESLLKK